MTTSIVLRDILSYSLQLALMIGAGAALVIAFRIREPKVTLACWRTLLVACLLLPLCQPWLTTGQTGAPPSILPASGAAVVGELSSTVASPPPWPLESLVLLILGAGIAIRALWLTIGAWTLSRLRRTASPLVSHRPRSARLKHELECGLASTVSDRVAGPITFGLRHPVVIVPPSVLAMAPHVQEAIACHELLHVRRRDWLFEVLEETIRTVFWFHPGVWWLIGRIQLCREEVVDRAAVGLTASKERYIDALLVVASKKSGVALVPAPLFLRRRLLRQRVALILQETTMTNRRLIASLTASTAALALAATVAVRSFPLEAQGQSVPAQESTGAPIQIVKGGEHLLHGSLAEYPRRAIEQRVQGDVVLDVVTDDRGEVSDARVVSGPDELRRAALESVLQWHYSPEALRSTTLQATLRFSLPAANAEFESRGYAFRMATEDAQKADLDKSQHAEHVMKELSVALQDPNASDQQIVEWKRNYEKQSMLLNKMLAEGASKDGAEYTVRLAPRRPLFEGTPRLVRIGGERVTSETMKEFVQRAGLSIGDPITEDMAKRATEVARNLDEHLRVSFQRDGSGGLIIMLLNP